MSQNRTMTVVSFQPPSSKLVEGCHPQNASASSFVEAHLEHHGENLDNKEGTDDDHKQLCAGDNRHTCHQAAQSKRARISHEDLGGVAVPPQESNAGAKGGGTQHGDIQRISHLVAANGVAGGGARIAELPEGDDGVGTHHQCH